MIGFVYKIFDNTNGNVYYGSTIETISRRMTHHRSKYKTWVAGNGGKCKSFCKSFDILKNNDYSYSLVEQVEYENKMELLRRERFWIENNECVNKLIPIRSQDEKIEYQKVYDKEYREQNRERIKEYRERNREQILEQQKEYRERNRELINEKKRERRAKKNIVI